jgi:5-methylcytosine-specific restriction endonuclease McrA
MSRDLTTKRRTVFGEVQPGTECRICGRNVDDARRKTCSDYCDNIQTAVMGMLNWTSVRRKILDRDDETCQQCGYKGAWERRARDHLRELIKEAAGERPESPPLDEPERIDAEFETHHEAREAWRERREAAKERYGNPHSVDGRGLQVDHITPVADGGHPFDPANLQTLCTDCHKAKTAAENSERGTPSRGELSESLFEYVSEEEA